MRSSRWMVISAIAVAAVMAVLLGLFLADALLFVAAAVVLVVLAVMHWVPRYDAEGRIDGQGDRPRAAATARRSGEDGSGGLEHRGGDRP